MYRIAHAATSGYALALILAGLAYAVAYPNAVALGAEALTPAEEWTEDAPHAAALCYHWGHNAPEACAALARDTNARTVADALGQLD